jgi:AcrR family transcriptional regulator
LYRLVVVFTSRSQTTRDGVLAAARRAFAAHGYERATVRAIAADAGVDASMVIRYYRSKDELFMAATDIDLALPDLTRVPHGERGAVLARRFVALWDEPATGEVLTLLLRSAPTSARAADRIRDIFASQVLGMVRRLKAHGPSDAPTVVADPAWQSNDSNDDPAIRRAAALGSFILGSALARYILALPPMATAPAAEAAEIMAPVIDSILQSPQVAGIPRDL